jgi:peroxiredoxin Q/BCP
MKKIGISASILMLALSFYAFAPVEKGEKVPDFMGLDENGENWTLYDQRADYIVVYFYPAAFTGGCTRQACAYRDHDEGFSKLNATIIGVSGDEYENLGKFKDHHNLNFSLISDADGKIAGIFGVPVKDGNTIEKEVEGEMLQLSRTVTTARQTFVLDANFKLIYKDNEVSAASDPETVLKFISTHDERKSCVPNK